RRGFDPCSRRHRNPDRGALRNARDRKAPRGDEEMNGHGNAKAPVSAPAAPAGVGARNEVSGNVLGDGTGIALGTGRFTEHTGEPAPASPPPPPAGAGPHFQPLIPVSGLPPGRFRAL